MRNEGPRTLRIKVRDEHGQVIGEKEVVSFRGLLEMVHEDRLQETSTVLIQAPAKENGDTAIVRAIIRTSRGSFSGIGDASPRNVSAMIAPHIIPMAETRALARAMRLATGCGMTALEELPDGSFELAHANDGDSRPASGQPDHRSAFDHYRAPRRVPGQRFGGMLPPDGAPNGNGHGSGNGQGGTNGQGHGNGQGNGGGFTARASEQARRYLYRLLAQQGKTGEAARAFIRETLGVDSLDHAPKHAVSALIDALKAEIESRNGPGHGPSNGHAGGHGGNGSNGSYRDNGTNG